MPEHNGLGLGGRPDDPEKNAPGSKKISRRAFVVGGAAAAVGAAIVGGPKIIKKAGEWYEKYEAEKLNESVEKEKGTVKKDIEQGLQDQQTYKALRTRYNYLVEQSRRFDEDSDDFKKLQPETDQLFRRLRKFRTTKGNTKYGLLEEANPYAEALKSNDAAIAGLATARVLYREWVDKDFSGNKEFSYWHNRALAYQELGSVSEQKIQAKLGTLFKYAKANSIKVSQISQEQILYSLIDDNFDFSLTPEVLEVVLSERSPDWQRHPATHADRDSYGHYNDLSVLDIFELNRLKAVLSQISDRTFIADVFRARDEDFKNIRAELGGVIPRPTSGNRLKVLAGSREKANDVHVLSSKEVVESFTAAASFHFHATQKKESLEVQGPSGGDNSAFFAPDVVFSSVDDATILVHFYVSRAIRDINGELEEVKNEVVCLGEIKK